MSVLATWTIPELVAVCDRIAEQNDEQQKQQTLAQGKPFFRARIKRDGNS